MTLKEKAELVYWREKAKLNGRLFRYTAKLLFRLVKDGLKHGIESSELYQDVRRRFCDMGGGETVG